jgi:hypothetical protein
MMMNRAMPATVQEQRRKHARDVKLESALQDFKGKSRAASAGAGNEFTDHRADQGEPARNAQAAEPRRSETA